MTVLLWFRNDLRLSDHAALTAAVESGHDVLPVYVLDEGAAGIWAPGGASRWWLHHSLAALDASLSRMGARLILRRGSAGEHLRSIARETKAVALHAGRAVEPWARTQESALEAALSEDGVAVHWHRTVMLFDQDALRTKSGGPFHVYSPFARACMETGGPPPPLPAPARVSAPARLPRSDCSEAWALLPAHPDWAGEIRATWTTGEAAAQDRLRRFVPVTLADYAAGRDRPRAEGTSRLSPHLHFGEISPVQVWHAAREIEGRGSGKFIGELLWREFSIHLLWHQPHLPDRPLRAAFASMAYRDDPAGLRAWQRGRTGIPIVDAGMRQLWRTGWMHNRVRLIAASFLVKHLLINWREGEAWFWDTLVDADLANNSASWQWVAGSGTDSAPFVRIFNPVLQARKFDPDGDYVRTYVPELASLPAPEIHAPWEVPEIVLRGAGVVLGRTYPRPILDLGTGRARALAAYAGLGGGEPGRLA
ncbi:MAG TPA: deoxyribodipyrimidine photo-lyase [Acetobacteraceae bacterium]|nr:deoxyribodipyrimidine photo-lyase [Acetobacteraceae bacterium]